MDETSTITPSESPTSFSALPAESWKEPAANADSGTGSQPVETPHADATSAPSPEGATVPSAETPREGAEGNASSPGPIPFDRHKAILDARAKEHADLEAKWQRVQWAETLVNAGKSPEQVQQAMSLWDGVDAYPGQFLENFYEELRNHPQLRSVAQAFAEKLIREAQEDAEPQPVYYEATDPQTGQRGRFLSEQYLKDREAWIRRQADKRIAPLERNEQQRAERQQTLEAANKIYKGEFDSMKSDFEDVKKLPFFEEIKGDIKALVERSDYKMSLHKAYTTALNEKIIPTLGERQKTQVLAELRTQANASGLKPGAPATGTPGPAPKNFKDLPREAWK